MRHTRRRSAAGSWGQDDGQYDGQYDGNTGPMKVFDDRPRVNLAFIDHRPVDMNATGMLNFGDR